MPERTNSTTRRAFLAASAAALSAPALAQHSLRDVQRRRDEDRPPDAGPRPVVISSGNGRDAVARACRLLSQGADPLDAVVSGVELVENDPEDMSVGLGGLPNEEGVVELDSSVMHGPTHRAGAVAALRNIKNPAQVAREVARRTDHVMIVGEGALKFARRMGFTEESLLTEKARRAWLEWRASLSDEDDWLAPDEFDLPTDVSGRRGAVDIDAIPDVRRLPNGVLHTYGTIHCSGVTADGDLGGATTTSGLSWKLPGRVGDSPIIGAGLYTDNAVGSAGATGRGEAVIQVSGARLAVMRMEAGDHPTDACLFVLRHIAERTRSKRLLDERGRPSFNVVMYALRKDGAYGSACMWSGRQFAVCDMVNGARLEDCAAVYETE